MKNLNLVTIGGGTGMSTMLRGLKNYTRNITAIVTMADDGGGSGKLREDLGVLPPGDVRNCLVALATAEPMMEELFRYRFPCGVLRGQSVGNLIIAAMDGIYGSFEEAIRNVSKVLAISGRVLPVTTENIHIRATLSDGADEMMREYFAERVKAEDFGNGREARSLLENTVISAAARVMELPEKKRTRKVMQELTAEDVKEAIQRLSAGNLMQRGRERKVCGF